MSCSPLASSNHNCTMRAAILPGRVDCRSRAARWSSGECARYVPEPQGKRQVRQAPRTMNLNTRNSPTVNPGIRDGGSHVARAHITSLRHHRPQLWCVVAERVREDRRVRGKELPQVCERAEDLMLRMLGRNTG